MLDSDKKGVFPPNTLFRLLEVKEAGSWEAPGGKMPQVRLLVVSATFRAPRAGISDMKAHGKLCGAVNVLRYGSKHEYMRGLDDILSKPMITMAQARSGGEARGTAGIHGGDACRDRVGAAVESWGSAAALRALSWR